ncbi:type II secretion system protein GspG [Saccharophagus degradans]|nr:type II secretion system protein GspG [Saccharophagus degradans]
MIKNSLMIFIFFVGLALGILVAKIYAKLNLSSEGQMRFDLLNIETALVFYRNEFGAYPEGAVGLSVLYRNGKSGGEPYIDREILDPWGRKYNYGYISVNGVELPFVWSYGDPQFEFVYGRIVDKEY